MPYWWETGGWQYFNSGADDSLAQIYDAGYIFQGDATLAVFTLTAPRGQVGTIRMAAEQWAVLNGLTLLTVHVREDQVFWPFSDYAVWVHAYGSPIATILLGALAALVVLALLAITIHFFYSLVKYGPEAALQTLKSDVLNIAQVPGETVENFASRAGAGVGKLAAGVGMGLVPVALIAVGLLAVLAFAGPRITPAIRAARGRS